MPTIGFESRLKSLDKRLGNNEEISESNKKLLKDLKRDLEVQDYSQSRVYKVVNLLKIVAEHIDYDFEEADIEDIKDTVVWINKRDLSDATKRDYRTILKMFYKWLNGGEYPDKVEWISTAKKRSNNTLPKDVLTEDDIKKLVGAANNARDKALVSVLWETGARIGELIDLTIGDIEDHRYGKKIVIQGKTGARRIPLISSVPHLQAWLNNHPSSDEKEAPLWVNLGTANRNPGKQIQYRTITKQLNKTADRAGIDKPVNPHHFRHSRATYLASKFTESQLCEWFGWVQGSDRPADYVHMSGRDIDGDYARLHGIKDKKEPEKSQLAPKECPRCSEKVAPDASFCQNCGQALTRGAFQEVEKKKEAAEGRLEDLLSDPEFKKMVSERIDKSIADKIGNE